MIEAILVEYKCLLLKRKKAILELDGERLERILKEEEKILDKLQEELNKYDSLPSSVREIMQEVWKLHDEIAVLTFEFMETIKDILSEMEETK